MMAKRIVILLLILVLLSGCFGLMILSLLQTTIVSGALAAFNSNQTSNSKPGEWVMEGYNPQRDRASSAPITPPLKLAQEYSIGGQTPLGSPVTVTADLVLVEGDHRLYALTRQGQEQWSIDLPGSFLSPAVAGPVVFVRAEMDQTGYLLAIQANSGEQLWQFEFPKVGSQYGNLGGHVTAPVIVDGLVLVGAGQAFYALEVETGRPFWSYNIDEPITSAAAVAGETILFTDFKQLYALDLQSGRQRWRFQPEDGTVAQLFAPVVDREQVITSSGNTVYALDHQTGRLLWRSQISAEEKLIPAGADGEQVYVKSVQRLYALDRGSGVEVWSYGATNFVSLPAISGDYLYVITRAAGQAQLRALNRQNGQAVWQVEDGQLANAAPVIAGQQVYVRTGDGRVWVYEPAVETR
jgi:outer membrane protein assembly factor BamB